MRRAFFCLALICVPMGSAVAQTIQGVLSSEELENEMYGVELSGVAGISDLPWTECIEPDGDTVYTYQGVQLVGKMKVRPGGLACFDYGQRTNATQNCFSVMRNGEDGYVFSGGARNGGQFRTESVRRDVKACPKGPAKVS